MPPLPVLPGSRVVSALERAGFKVTRIRGSHHVIRTGVARPSPSMGTRTFESARCAASCGTAD